MTRSRHILHSRIALRIFLLFAACALVPILLLVGFYYHHMVTETESRSLVELKQQNKAVALSIYERLLLLETELRLIAQQPDQALNSDSILGDYGPRHFLNTSVYHPATRRWVWRNDASGLIPAWPETRSTLSISRLPGGQIRMTMSVQVARTTGKPAMAAGIINPAYLWDLALPFNADLHVMDLDGHQIHGRYRLPDRVASRAAAAIDRQAFGHDQWEREGNRRVSAWRLLFLNARFDGNNWLVALTSHRKDALAELISLKSTFPIVIGFSFIFILLLSLYFLGKTTKPIQRLIAGTEAIARGDFASPVRVTSNDEFKTLADAFNSMAGMVKRQISDMKLLSDIGAPRRIRKSPTAFLESCLAAIEADGRFPRGIGLVISDTHARATRSVGFGVSQTTLSDASDMAIPDAWQFLIDQPGIPACLPPPDITKQPSSPLGEGNWIGVTVGDADRTQALLLVDTGIPFSQLPESLARLLETTADQMGVRLDNIAAYRTIQERENHFRQAFEHTAAGMIISSLSNTMYETNAYFREMVGQDDAALLSQNLIDLVDPEDREKMVTAQARLEEEGVSPDVFECRFRHSNGDTVWSLVSMSTLRDFNGKPLFYLSLLQDISKQKEAEAQQRQLENQLIQSQKLEAMGTLAGGIAHDFNNILSGILGHTQLGMIDQSLPDGGRARFDKIYSAAIRASELVKQILSFTRQSKQKIGPVDLEAVVQEAVTLLRASTPAHIQIDVTLSEPLPLVMADATRLHQIVMNLATNARLAMDDSDGSLCIGLATETFTADTLPNVLQLKVGTYVRLTVTDTGCGMDAATLERVFDPYFTTRERGKGTGLGLAMVHNIVKSYGGSIAVKSTPGTGTCFTLLIPATQAKSGLKRTNTETTLPRGNESICLVDDEEIVGDTVSHMLEMLGYTVTYHARPEEALTAIGEGQAVDLVITDFSMPGIPGDQLALELAQINPDVPVILCTGYSDAITETKAKAAGIRHIVQKPILTDTIAVIVRQVLDGNVVTS